MIIFYMFGSLGGEDFVVLSMHNISEVKSKFDLERTFFHDLKNRLNSLTGAIGLIRSNRDNLDLRNELIDLSDDIVKDLITETNNYRLLSKAESGVLVKNIKEMDIADILEYVKNEVNTNPASYGKAIEILNTKNRLINTDKNLLSRVLSNMLLNAVEASAEGDKIKISYNDEGKEIVFLVFNRAVIPEEIKNSIFSKKQLSSKGGNDRGTGTYSIKLLGEKYLKGNVNFKSDNESGTIFSLRIPEKID